MDLSGVLRLNEPDVEGNPPYGSHDPSMMWDPRSGKYYSYCTDFGGPGNHGRRIGIPVRVSGDLVHFTYHGPVLSPASVRQARDNGEYPPTRAFWAPYVEYSGEEYRMYYSATRDFGSSESRIWLAVAKDPLGPFENRGVAVDSWGTDDSLPNAIDPHVLHTPEGQVWLIYGSFFGGIYMKELRSDTGLPVDPDPRFLGQCVAHKMPPPALDGPEGAAIQYCPETGYYYLFLSYGWLGDGYDIRVGRSRAPLGPYLDYQGRDMAGKSLGLKLANSYHFRAAAPNRKAGGGWQWGGLRGPGHGVPFFDPVSGRYFFVHHLRDGNPRDRRYDPVFDRHSYRNHYMMIRPMFFVDGWPVLGPEPYAGEACLPVGPPAGAMWEMIVLDDLDNRMKTSGNVRLAADSPLLRRSVCYRCADFENGGEALALTGIDEFGQCCWGKVTK